ncbi:hypothetical protein [Phycicoccus sp.]|uniref:hypothetical protein n=1 Tax=Phycicoccus sp. TaxID=1902410 RepID=UPI002BDB64B0|nr:hypothetical protein [Phycicoccus sp.]HMM95294.1 hypothetical protein [Phycicoccus sp.]
MSADRYSVCPACVAGLATKIAELKTELAAAYGKVPVDLYEAKRDLITELQNQLDTVGNAQHTRTFREDWEFETPDLDSVAWSYTGACTRCGATASGRGEVKLERPA